VKITTIAVIRWIRTYILHWRFIQASIVYGKNWITKESSLQFITILYLKLGRC